MAERESKYANKLRELGFRKTPANYFEECLRDLQLSLQRPLTRPERRRIAKEMRKPSFTMETILEPPITRASDEYGFVWEADGHIDLKPLGFIDGAQWLEKRIGLKLPPPKKYN